MNKLLALLLLLALSAAGANSLPYHPFRKVGTNYYDLRPLYLWRIGLIQKQAASNAATRESVAAARYAPDDAKAVNAAGAKSSQAAAAYKAAKNACPLPAWVPSGAYTVAEVWKDGLLLLGGTAGPIALKG